MYQRCPASPRRLSTSRSEIAVCSLGSQFTKPPVAVDQAVPVQRSRRSRAPPSERPSSMVKRSRRQSSEAPRRRSWRVIGAARLSSFQSQTRSEERGRGPWRWRVPALGVARRRSTTIWVAMPAWSVPGCHKRVAALHPAPARPARPASVIVEGVADVEAAGDVRRRDHDGEGRRLAAGVGVERALLLPSGVKRSLRGRMIEALAQHAPVVSCDWPGATPADAALRSSD